eukprot:TRINITY_DN4476_c0_g1_i1.p1 TRINITY_DN4476_c0_g1~~TRINITY_DN4476_c0_g1_i1.p1  ORF type:complete len:180 (+),score=39.94 TRINITY_DN4476_c0_g1_i1:69-608(+)
MSQDNFDEIVDSVVAQNKLQKEATSNEQLLFGITGFLVSIVPIYLYTSIFNMPLKDYAIFYLALTVVSTGLMSYSYNKVAEQLRIKLSARNSEVSSRASKDKAANKNEKKKQEEQLKDQLNVLTRQEATAFSLLYNNLFFLLLVVFLAFYVLQNLPALQNYVMTIGVAGGLVLLSSVSK